MLALLVPVARLDKTIEFIEQATSMQRAHPDCGSIKLYRHGHAHGLQRYRCRECSRTCNVLKGTPLARLHHKPRWLNYLSGMLDSRSVRRDADLGIASATSFRWRHCFLRAKDR